MIHEAPGQSDAVALYTRVLEAWNRRDARGFAELFTETGSAVGFDGSQMDGREQIEQDLAEVFANHPTARYVAKIREVRSIGAHGVLIRSVVGMVPPGKSDLDPTVNAVQTLLAVTEGAEPKIALLQSTPAAFHGRPHLVEQLTRELSAVLDSGLVVDEGR